MSYNLDLSPFKHKKQMTPVKDGFCYLSVVRFYNITYGTKIKTSDFSALGPYPELIKFLYLFASKVDTNKLVPVPVLKNNLIYHFDEEPRKYMKLLDLIRSKDMDPLRVGGEDFDREELSNLQVQQVFKIIESAGGDLGAIMAQQKMEWLKEHGKEILNEAINKQMTMNITKSSKKIYLPFTSTNRKTEGVATDELLLLRYPEFDITFRSNKGHPHSIAANCRILERELLLLKCNYALNKIASDKKYDFLYCEIGANPMMVVDTPNIHACVGIVAIRDNSRFTKFVAQMDDKVADENICKDELIRYDKLVRGKSHQMCYGKAQNCKITAKYLIFLHSNYDMKMNDILDIMIKKKSVIAHLCFIFDESVLVQEEGYIRSMGVYFKKFYRRDIFEKVKYISFSFVGDASLSYTHRWDTYTSLIFKTYVTRGIHTYEIQKSDHRINTIYVDIVKCTTPQAVIHKREIVHYRYDCISTNRKVLLWYDLKVDLTTKRGYRLIKKYLIVSSVLYNLIYQFLIKTEKNAFTIAHALKAASSYNTRCTYNGTDIIPPEYQLDSEQLFDVVFVIYMIVYRDKNKNGTLLQSLVADEKLISEIMNAGFFSRFCRAFTNTWTGDSNWLDRITKVLKVFKQFNIEKLRCPVGSVDVIDQVDITQYIKHLLVADETEDIGYTKTFDITEDDDKEIITFDNDEYILKGVEPITPIVDDMRKKNKNIEVQTIFDLPKASLERNREIFNMTVTEISGVNNHCCFRALLKAVDIDFDTKKFFDLFKSYWETNRDKIDFGENSEVIREGIDLVFKDGIGSLDFLVLFSKISLINVLVVTGKDVIQIIDEASDDTSLNNSIILIFNRSMNAKIGHYNLVNNKNLNYNMIYNKMFKMLTDLVFNNEKYKKLYTNIKNKFFSPIYKYIKINKDTTKTVFKLNDILQEFKISKIDRYLEIGAAPGGTVLFVQDHMKSKVVKAYTIENEKINIFERAKEKIMVANYLEEEINYNDYDVVFFDAALDTGNNKINRPILENFLNDLKRDEVNINKTKFVVKIADIFDFYYDFEFYRVLYPNILKNIDFIKPKTSNPCSSEVYAVLGSAKDDVQGLDRLTNIIKDILQSYQFLNVKTAEVDVKMFGGFEELEEELDFKTAQKLYPLYVKYFRGLTDYGECCDAIQMCGVLYDEKEEDMTSLPKEDKEKNIKKNKIFGKFLNKRKTYRKVFNPNCDISIEADSKESWFFKVFRAVVNSHMLSNRSQEIFLLMSVFAGFMKISIEQCYKMLYNITFGEECTQIFNNSSKLETCKALAQLWLKAFRKDKYLPIHCSTTTSNIFRTFYNSHYVTKDQIDKMIMYNKTNDKELNMEINSEIVRATRYKLNKKNLDLYIKRYKEKNKISKVNDEVNNEEKDDNDSTVESLAWDDYKNNIELQKTEDVQENKIEIINAETIVENKVEEQKIIEKQQEDVNIKTIVDLDAREEIKEDTEIEEVIRTKDESSELRSLTYLIHYKLNNKNFISNKQFKIFSNANEISNLDTKVHIMFHFDKFYQFTDNIKDRENMNYNYKDDILNIGIATNCYAYVSTGAFTMFMDKYFPKDFHWNILFNIHYSPYIRYVDFMEMVLKKYDINTFSINIVINNKSTVELLNKKYTETFPFEKDNSLFAQLQNDTNINMYLNKIEKNFVAPNVTNAYEKNARAEILAKLNVTSNIINNNLAKLWLQYFTAMVGKIPGSDEAEFILNGTDSEHTYAFDGKTLVAKLGNKFSTNSKIVLISKETKIMNDKIMSKNIMKYIDQPIHENEYMFINGLAGCGKSYNIIANYNIDCDMILTATRANAEDLRVKYMNSKNFNKKDKEKQKKLKTHIRTIDSLLCAEGFEYRNVRTLYVDEVFMVHAGSVSWCSQIIKPKFVLAFGDIRQIPYIERTLQSVRFANITKFSKCIDQLNVSLRCPMDVAYLFNSYYQNRKDDPFKIKPGFLTTNSRSNSLRLMIDISMSTLKSYISQYKTEVIFMTFKEAEAATLRESKIPALTVHQQQGVTSKYVVIVRLSTKPNDEIYKSDEHILVALTRHTITAFYHTPIHDKMANMISKNTNVQSIKIKKQLVDKAYVFKLPEKMNLYQEMSIVRENVYINKMFGGAKDEVNKEQEYVVEMLDKYDKKGPTKKKYLQTKNPFTMSRKEVTELFIGGSFGKSNIFSVVEDFQYTNQENTKIKNMLLANGYTDGLTENLVKEFSYNDLNYMKYKQDFRPRLIEPSVVILQEFFDILIPGASYREYDQDPMLIEVSNLELFSDPFKFDPGMKLPAKRLYDKLSPRLKTHMPATRPNSQLETLIAVIKRNLLVPHLQAKIDHSNMVKLMVKKFINTYIPKSNMAVLEGFYNNKIVPNFSHTNSWLETQAAKLDRNVDEEFSLEETDLSYYNCMIKPTPKPVLDTTGINTYSALQTICYHDKNVNTIFCSIFRILKKRLLMVLDSRFKIFTDVSPEDFSEMLSTEFDAELLDNFNKLEIDISKYDKSQGKLFLDIEMEIYRVFGIPEDLLLAWYKAHQHTTLYDRVNKLKFFVDYQRKSGNASTYLGNTIVLMVVLSCLFNLDDAVLAMFSGDDSLIVSKNQLYDRNSECANLFNLESKFFRYKNSYFCSKFLLNIDGHFRLIPDPLKILIKLGRSDLVNFEHVEDYRISCCDLLNVYDDVRIDEKLSMAMDERYGKDFKLIDYSVMIHNILGLIRDKEHFRNLYYIEAGANINYDPSRPKLD